MKICILTCFGDLMLRDTGYSVRIYNLAKYLASLGNEVHVIMPEKEDTLKYVDGFVIHGIKGVCPAAVLRVLGRLIGASKFSALYFYDLLFISKATRIISECDLVQLEQQFAGGFLVPLTKRMGKALSIDCHDVFQALRVKHTNTVRRIIETVLEFTVYRRADIVLTVSEIEKAYLKSYGIDKARIKVVPNGVDIEAFGRQLDGTTVNDSHTTERVHSVVFVGNIEYPPNQEAVRIISQEIAPRVQKNITDVEFLVVGRILEKRPWTNLLFTGVVDDVNEVLTKSDVAIAPLFHGSGTRLKILEYLSCSLPVIATSVAVEGLPVKNGVNILIEDDIEQFANKVTRTLKDKVLSLKLGKAGREFVVKNYDWKIIASLLSRAYRDLLLAPTKNGRRRQVCSHQI